MHSLRSATSLMLSDAPLVFLALLVFVLRVDADVILPTCSTIGTTLATANTSVNVWGLIRAALLAWGRTHGKDWNASTFS